MLESMRRRSALADVYRTGTFGPQSTDGPGVWLAERQALVIVEIQVWPDMAAATLRDIEAVTGIELPRGANRAALQKEGTAAICIGPHRWLVVEQERRDLYDLIRAATDTRQAAVIDQSHGRIGLRLSGPNVRDLLSKGTSIDLRPARFPAGCGTATRLERFTVVLHCIETECFDLFALRSYAVSLYEWLLDAAIEFGCRIDPPVEDG